MARFPRTFSRPLLLCLLLLPTAGIHSTRAEDAPLRFSPRSGPPAGIPGNRDALWSQPPDLNGYKVSSEIIGQFGLESKIADDFIAPVDTTVNRVTFWGGYYNWTPGDPEVARYNLGLCAEDGCSPPPPEAQFLHLEAATTFIGYDGFGYPTYRYQVEVAFDVLAERRYWLFVQADDHTFPPQWGRQQALEERECEAVFCDTWAGWWCSPVSDLVGEPWDASFEIEAAQLLPGACCMPDGTCEILEPGDCLQAGGDPYDSVTGCTPNPCSIVGACCVDGFCSSITPESCWDHEGQFLGSGVPCEPNPCPDQPQACCMAGFNHCYFWPPDDCRLHDGYPMGPGTTCDPDPCEGQACCMANGTCEISDVEFCELSGGVAMGVGTTCDPDPCTPPQACCFAFGTCRLWSPEPCMNAGGVPLGEGTSCVPPSPCLPPETPRACCLPDHACLMLDAPACVAAGGTTLMPDVGCDPDPCASQTIARACCHADGSCTLVLPEECLDGGAIPLGACSICDTDPCPPPVQGACCLPTGACVETLPVRCDELHGAWYGGECSMDLCPPPVAVEKTTWGRVRGMYR